MKNSFAPVFSGILDSSLWEEDYAVRILFVSMLALKDSDHVVRFNDYQLHRRANLKLEEVQAALKLLAAPDPRRTGQEHEGRRIKKTDDGWLILNGQFYENQMRLVSLRAYQARKQREYRERKNSPPLKGEAATQRALAVGDQTSADAIEAELEEAAVKTVATSTVAEPPKAARSSGANIRPQTPPAPVMPPRPKPPPMADARQVGQVLHPVMAKLQKAKAPTVPSSPPPGGNLFAPWQETTVSTAPSPRAPARPQTPPAVQVRETLSEEPPVE